jgi:eukaryotic translation initiation factor 2C
MASRGQGRGGRGGRGGGRGAPRGMSNPPSLGPPAGVAGHIETIGVRRPGFGTAGRPLPIIVNSFPTTIPDGIICHYDGKSAFFALAHYLT